MEYLYKQLKLFMFVETLVSDYHYKMFLGTAVVYALIDLSNAGDG